MTDRRRRLNNRRDSENFDLECGGQPYTCTFSMFSDDNTLAEIFSESAKNGSSADVASRDAAIACALQHGADADTLRRALWDIHGKAQGPLATALDMIVGLVVRAQVSGPCIMGVDPGVSGAFCWSSSRCERCRCSDCRRAD
jgi:hypothetical protein